jgi:PAS domain S-box-containing protein
MSETTASRITTISRVYLIIALFVALIFCLVLLIQIQMDALTAVRAYVGGEGLWAKAQKDAIRSLEHYVISRNEADYQSCRRFIQVPLGDLKARIELQKPNPNLDIVREGFLKGHNNPVDIEYMITFFRRFQHTAYMTQAIEHWTAADQLIVELNGVAEKLHDGIATGRDKPEAVRALLTRLDSINLQVTEQEDLFSSTLADASRWANDVARNLTYAIALLFVVLGVGMSWPIITRIRVTENTLLESEERLRSIFEHVDDIIFIVESDGTFSSISPSSERMIGWSPDELISRPFLLFIQPDDLPRTQERFMKAQAGESLPVFQTRILTKTGGIFGVRDCGYPNPSRRLHRHSRGNARHHRT